MTYKRHHDRITLEMTVEEHEHLMLYLGYAGGCAGRHNEQALKWESYRMTNAINTGNANWQPYDIPEDAPRIGIVQPDSGIPTQ
jgi:hypothetical protein